MIDIVVEVCPKCGADLIQVVYTTYAPCTSHHQAFEAEASSSNPIPPIHAQRCPKCGWSKEERDVVIRVPHNKKTNREKLMSLPDKELAGMILKLADFSKGYTDSVLGLTKWLCEEAVE